jgi:hypothetical protein
MGPIFIRLNCRRGALMGGEWIARTIHQLAKAGLAEASKWPSIGACIPMMVTNSKF